MSKSRFIPFEKTEERESIIKALRTATKTIEDMLKHTAKWRYGMYGTNLEKTKKYQKLDDAEFYLRTAVEWLSWIAIPDELHPRMIKFKLYPKGSPSRQYNPTPRSVQLKNATVRLTAVSDFLVTKELNGLSMGILAVIEELGRIEFFQFPSYDQAAALKLDKEVEDDGEEGQEMEATESQ